MARGIAHHLSSGRPVRVPAPVTSRADLETIAGHVHVINMLWAELEIAMALTGCRTIQDVTKDVLWNRARPTW